MSLEEVYLGNPLLKKANVQQEFTKEQILEFMACKNDPVYFAKQHVKIVSLDCLLYTSPSPRDRTRSRMPSSA